MDRSTLRLKWRDRVIGGAQTPRRFLDFVIDGQSLYLSLGDLISPLGWLSEQETEKAVGRLLLTEASDFPDDRRSIYVCPECGDLGCGAVSAVIERVGSTFAWRDFGNQNNYDENVGLDDYREFGPIVFDAEDYERVLRSALALSQEQ